MVGEEAEIIGLKKSFRGSSTTAATTAATAVTEATAATTAAAISFVKVKIINIDQCQLHHISPYQMCANTIQNHHSCSADGGGKDFNQLNDQIKAPKINNTDC